MTTGVLHVYITVQELVNISIIIDYIIIMYGYTNVRVVDLQSVQHEATWFSASDYLLPGGGILQFQSKGISSYYSKFVFQ